ncbi:MAG: hypothetical protein ACT4R6_06915 [Gemmatimonadaceae bacterium]
MDRSARLLSGVAAILVLATSVPSRACAQDSLRVLSDTTRVQVLQMRDGTTLVGRVTAVRGDSVEIRTAGGEVIVARSAVRRVRERSASAMRGGEYWPAEPNETRHFFAPTGRMLRQGDAYFCDIWVFLLCLTGGLTDRITFGGGMTVVPGIDISDNVFYLTPKVGVYNSERVNVALGAFAGWSGLVTDAAASFGVLYGVGTFGEADRNVSAGLGYAYYSDELADRPLLLAGTKLRISRGTAFISENYVLPGSQGGIVSFGLRFFGERVAGDVALWRYVGKDDAGQGIGFPFVGLTVKLD